MDDAQHLGLEWFLADLATVLELHVGPPAIVVEPRGIYLALESRIEARQTRTFREGEAQEHALNLVIRLQYLAENPPDRDESRARRLP